MPSSAVGVLANNQMLSEKEDKNGQTGTGEYNSESLSAATTGPYAVQKSRRRRSRKKKRSKSNSRLWVALGVGFACLIMVGLGTFIGLSYRSDENKAERFRNAQAARESARAVWLADCTGKGNLAWACNKFDRAHFEKAAQLDRFECVEKEAHEYRCAYQMGSSIVELHFAEPYAVNERYLAPRIRAYATIVHSNADEEYFIVVSENGHIELHKQNVDSALVVINPSTGSMNTQLTASKPAG